MPGGHRYRVHYAGLPGKPDIVLPRHKTVVMVHGCFWHGHGCRLDSQPKTNSQFWVDKIARNKARDEQHEMQLLALGWKVFVAWECQILKKDSLEGLLLQIEEAMQALAPMPTGKLTVSFYEEIEDNVNMVAEEQVQYKAKKIDGRL